jgi:deazaflavin-dependent oxidoreductase (nitroreductase family)
MTQNANDGYGQVDWDRQSAWNRQIIEEFHANGGKVSGPMAGTPLLLLNTTGAKSGQPRISPLVYYNENGRVFIFATKAGAPTNPDWYHNILAHPNVTVEIGTEKFPATGVVLGEEERAQMYAKQAAASPRFAEYEKTTTRKIPVIELVRK